MRNGDWFLTFTGKQFYPIDPHPEDIGIWDIAHALARVCRFGGHCRQFYSVAQHSVLVSEHCEFNAFQGLMHDATEAYIGDMVRPLKLSMPDYKVAEARLWDAICERFDIPKEMNPEVKVNDNRALMTERRDLCTPTNHRWSLDELGFKPFDKVIQPLDPDMAEVRFMEKYLKLTKQ